MRTKVSKEGVLIPKRMLEGIDEVAISEKNGTILVVPVNEVEPIFSLGQHPIVIDVTDASEKHDLYL